VQTTVAAQSSRISAGGVANLYAVHPGVWRSLVARSVRVGEVPSSNLGTPMLVKGGNLGFPPFRIPPSTLGGRVASGSALRSLRERVLELTRLVRGETLGFPPSGSRLPPWAGASRLVRRCARCVSAFLSSLDSAHSARIGLVLSIGERYSRRITFLYAPSLAMDAWLSSERVRELRARRRRRGGSLCLA